MLLLVTVALVLAGLVLLIVGFVQDSLSLIYLSIACAAVAGIALIVFSRLSRRRAVRLALDGGPAAAAPPSTIYTRPRLAEEVVDRGPRPVPERELAYDEEEIVPQPLGASAEASFDDDYLPEAAAPEPTAPQPGAPMFVREPAPQMASAGNVPSGAGGHWEEQGEWQEDWGDEVLFPIEDYDELRVAEILPLLPQLEPDELEDVRDREVSTKARGTIIGRIDELLGGVDETAAAATARARPPAPSVRKAAAGTGKRAAPRRAVTGRAAAGAPAKRAGTTRKAAAAPARGSAKTAGTPARRSAAPAPSPTKKAGGTRKAAAGKSSTAAKGTTSRTGASKSATSGSATGSKTAAGKAAVARKAPARTTTVKSTTRKVATVKKAAQTTKSGATRAAAPTKKAVVKKAAGTTARQPRKR